MCIMTVHAGQRKSTMFEACAHNTNTVMGDVELLKSLLAARKDAQDTAQLNQAVAHLKAAYAGFLALFQEAAGAEHADPAGHVHRHEETVGNESSLVEVAHHDAQLARPFETR